MADQTENGDVITQRFSGGVVSWDRSKNDLQHRAGESGVLSWPVCRCRDRSVPKAPPQPAGVRHQRPQVVYVELVVAACDRSGADLGRAGGLCGAAQPSPRARGRLATERRRRRRVRRRRSTLGADSAPRPAANLPTTTPRTCSAVGYASGAGSALAVRAAIAGGVVGPRAADDADTDEGAGREPESTNAARRAQEPTAAQTRTSERIEPTAVDTAPTRVPTPVGTRPADRYRSPCPDRGRRAGAERHRIAPAAR